MSNLAKTFQNHIFNSDSFIYKESSDGSYTLVNTDDDSAAVYEIRGLATQFFKLILTGGEPSNTISKLAKEHQVSPATIEKDLKTFFK